MNSLRDKARSIIDEAIKAVLPEEAVKKALSGMQLPDGVVLVAIGKAAWNMASAAHEILGEHIREGIVLTKYQHSKGELKGLKIREAGHPLPDQNSVTGTAEILEMVNKLTTQDELLFLVSGGGSALFEKPLEGVSIDEIISATNQLLAKGADIVEMNTVRKHLSAVKGGRFAAHCNGAKIHTVVLSDIIGDPLDAIASGPAYPDMSTSDDALQIVSKYNLNLSKDCLKAIRLETPKSIENCETIVTGSVTELCKAAAQIARQNGFQAHILSTFIQSEAKEVGYTLAAIAREIASGKNAFSFRKPCAIILGGETLVQLKGNGKGGRNQELALAAATGIENLENVVIFSVGSDGTDGPTEAAGGMVDGQSIRRMNSARIDPLEKLNRNDSFHALEASGDLIITGPTGTNVNDLMMILCE
ncbi:glycerate kinase type-2 family protein [Mangrovibacterium lignilyticum]|uniref:glycerate kinase type-2 family protein n=1 Tax=Mangrovibacterium lignilyticum TaxID=2668052 RepID=UPI0013D6BD72|nr:glycerate kinase [Mangrovibacterium lignilyticum]